MRPSGSLTRSVTALLIASALLFLGLGCRGRTATDAAEVTVVLAHPPEMRALLAGQVERFALGTPRLDDGTRVSITLDPIPTEEGVKLLANGEKKVQGWLSPHDSFTDWVNANVVNLGSSFSGCRPLFRTPLVAAGRQSVIDAGLDREGRFDLLRLVKSLQEDLDTPGGLRTALLTARPFFSLTGYASLYQIAAIARVHALTGGTENGNPLHVLERFQWVVSGYENSESALLERARSRQATLPTVVLTTEQQLKGFNAPELAFAPITPAPVELTYSLCTADIDRVTERERAALRLFATFLEAFEAQRAGEQLGFRPALLADPDTPPSQRVPSLRASQKESIMGLLSEWPQLIRPTALTVVMDASGSMSADNLRALKESVKVKIASLSPRDRVAVVIISSEPALAVPLTPPSGEVIAQLDTVGGGGGSAVYDALKMGVDTLSQPEVGRYRKRIVLIADGSDRNSRISRENLLSSITSRIDRLNIQVAVVALREAGNDADGLGQITKTVGGQFYPSNDGDFPIALTRALGD